MNIKKANNSKYRTTKDHAVLFKVSHENKQQDISERRNWLLHNWDLQVNKNALSVKRESVQTRKSAVKMKQFHKRWGYIA